MKFSALVIALATMADAKMPSGMAKNAIQRKLNKVDHQSFLKRARKLEEAAADGDAEDEEDQAWEIDGTYSMQFDSCVSVNPEEYYGGDADADEDADEAQEYKDYGNWVEIQDYVVVNMVNSKGKVGGVYAIEVGQFVKDMGSMLYKQHSQYCEICEEMKCDEADDDDDDNANANADAEYDVVQTYAPKSQYNGDGALLEYVDCQTCATHCSAQWEQEEQEQEAEEDGDEDAENQGCRRRRANEGEDDVDDYTAWGYLKGISECQQFEYSNNGYSAQNNAEDEEYAQGLYMGYKCNQAGDGIDLGFFYDYQCKYLDISGRRSVTEEVEEGSEAFASFMHFRSLVKAIFSETMPCEDVEFVNPYDNEYDQRNNENANADADVDDWTQPANEYCQMALVGYEEEEEEEADREDQEPGEEVEEKKDRRSKNLNMCEDEDQELCATISYMSGKGNTNYFLSKEDLENEDEAEELQEDGDIFGFTNNMWGNYDYNEDGEYAEYAECDYDDNAGSYDYSAWAGRKNDGDEDSGGFSSFMPEDLSGLAIAGIVASVIAVVAIATIMLKKNTIKKESLSEYMLDETKPADEKIV